MVIQQHLQPPATPGAPYMLTVTIANPGPGEGQAEVVARLRSPGGDQIVAEEVKAVDLQPNETVQLTIPLQTRDIATYEATVEVQYPP
jgi:hypothetical protein